MEAERLQARDAVSLQNRDRLLKVLQVDDSSFLIVIAQPTRSDQLEWRLLTSPGTASLEAFESVVRENYLDNSASATCYTIRKAFHDYETQQCAIA